MVEQSESIEYRSSLEDLIESLLGSATSLNQKYENLYENAPDLFCTINTDGLITDCNQSCADHLGYKKAELIGKSIFDVASDEGLSLMQEFLESWKKTGITKNKLLRLKRKDGTIFPALINTTNLYDGGNLVGGNTVIKDVSEIYEEQKNLQNYETKLRTTLERSKKENEEKEKFLLKLTEEMRLNLVDLESFVHNMLQERAIAVNKAYADALTEIKNRSTVLLRIISYLYDMQKIEKGDLVLTKSTYQLSEILKGVINTYKPEAKSRGILITENISDILYCVCDRKRLVQVFTTLLLNAIDFCPKENGIIDIILKKENDNAKIIIKDNGTGITKENLESLFEKFYHLDLTVIRKHKEGGFGMPVCKGIIEAHGGKIWAESKGWGYGAAIHILLPLTTKSSETLRKIE